MNPEKIFCLGDSRTGTTSLHTYFMHQGIPSIHGYVHESGISPDSPIQENFDENWKRTLKFIHASGAQAFSDYPTRIYWRELVHEFPDAYFVLSRRKDTATWLGSMRRVFPHLNADDLAALARSYEKTNDDILKYFDERDLDILDFCIDDGNFHNSYILSEYLDLDPGIWIGKYNTLD